MCKKCDVRKMERDLISREENPFLIDNRLEMLLEELRTATNQEEEISERNPFG